MRISDWSSDVCSSDLEGTGRRFLESARSRKPIFLRSDSDVCLVGEGGSAHGRIWLEIRQHRHDRAIGHEKLMVRARDQVGIERNPCIGIVKNDRAFDPTFVVAGLMDSLFKGAGDNPIYIQLRPPQAMPNNPNAPADRKSTRLNSSH